MTLAEEMQNMMDGIKAIKLMNKTILKDIDKDASIAGIKKIANLMTMIEVLKVPDIVCAFEEVNGMDYFNDNQSGLA